MLTPEDVQVQTLGERQVPSPLRLSCRPDDGIANFVPDEARVRYQMEVLEGAECQDEIQFEKAGPRRSIYFEPARTRAAIVTCGGLCPGINNVIRSITLQLHHLYGVEGILGIRYGYSGLDPAVAAPPFPITPDFVEDIHQMGGTVLGSSRGPVDPQVALAFLEAQRIQILFCIGGDGTQRGAHRLHEEAARRGYPLAVVGIPKTIDNDIAFVWRTFGYSTALEKSREIIDSAHVEAKGARNGISIVKLMGREAGFIAAGATVASQEVNFTLVPEVPFEMEGEVGFLNCLKKRMLARGHAVIVVAEGAGQQFLADAPEQRDASGNIVLKDIGPYLQHRIREYFAAAEIPVVTRYFDPSYHIRSVPANSDDALFCDQLGRHAVHAGMAGKTDVLIGFWYNVFVHVPISLSTSQTKRMSPESGLWGAVLAATGQPARFGD